MTALFALWVSGLAIAYRNGAPVDVAPMGALLAKLQQTGAGVR